MTYQDMILEYLQEHGSITNKEASKEFGMTCFTARMSDLRKTHNIVGEWEEGRNRFGQKRRYLRYYLVEKHDEVRS